jgi:DNA-binding HxlR family transcriptional regulator
MGHDWDVMILAWLNRQPAGFSLANAFSNASEAQLSGLARRGLIKRVPGREAGDPHGYVITPEGKNYQNGD